jgi:DNA repair exonuclease SbcCD ATPase subunit
MNTQIIALRNVLGKMQQRYNQDVGARKVLRQQLSEAAEKAAQARTLIRTMEQAQILLSSAAEYARKQLIERIEETVTAALQAVYGDDYAFKVEMGTFRDQTAAEWKVVTHHGETTVTANPQDAEGGGIVDIVSMALRLSLIELSRPKVTGPIILDEPGKMVSAEYRPAMAEFLREYARRTKRQIVMVTHHHEFAEMADVSYKVQLNDIGESVVTRL